jgi:integrase
MFKGTRYRVTCEDLHVPRDRLASYQAANAWWERKKAELILPSPQEIEAEATRRNWEVAADTLADDPVKRELLQNLLRPAHVPAHETLAAAVQDYLAILTKKQKPKTFKEVSDCLTMLRSWWPDLSVKQINEGWVKATNKLLTDLNVSANTKKKRWNIIKAFVRDLDESGQIDQPRNLDSRRLGFKVTKKKLPERSFEEVRNALANLPERLRLYALLGLNCGMTNVDMANLTKDMIANGYLTRKRVKTADHANVPDVSYKLWSETLDLLHKFKSDHPTLYLTSETGTKLVENRIEDGKVKEKDLIYLAWKRTAHRCPITASKFRNVGATLLDKSPEYGRYILHFLGQSPKSVMDQHYKAPSQEVFDQAVTWLHAQLFKA